MAWAPIITKIVTTFLGKQEKFQEQITIYMKASKLNIDNKYLESLNAYLAQLKMTAVAVSTQDVSDLPLKQDNAAEV